MKTIDISSNPPSEYRLTVENFAFVQRQISDIASCLSQMQASYLYEEDDEYSIYCDEDSRRAYVARCMVKDGGCLSLKAGAAIVAKDDDGRTAVYVTDTDVDDAYGDDSYFLCCERTQDGGDPEDRRMRDRVYISQDRSGDFCIRICRATIVDPPKSSDPFARGMIMLWSGYYEATIPKGWTLCDGGEHLQRIGQTTDIHIPDLRGRFVLGGTYMPGMPGTEVNGKIGEAGVFSYPVKTASHSHLYGDTVFTGSDNAFNAFAILSSDEKPDLFLHIVESGMLFSNSAIGNKARYRFERKDYVGAATGDSVANTQKIVPPYYALAYIIKY